MQWLFDIVVAQMELAGFIRDWPRARIWQDTPQAIPSSVFTRINLDTESFSNRVTVGLAQNRLTIQDDGYYLVLGYVTLGGMATGRRMHSAIKVNNDWAAYGVSNVSRVLGENPAILTATFKYLETGDFLDLWVYHDDIGNKNTQGTEYATWLGCHRQS